MEATRPVPEARVGTIVQLDTTRLPAARRCGGLLVDWLVDMGASTTLLSVSECKHMQGLHEL